MLEIYIDDNYDNYESLTQSIKCMYAYKGML